MERYNNNMTAMYKSSTSHIWEVNKQGFFEVKLKGIRVNTLETFLLKLREESRVQQLLDLMVAVAAKESGFNAGLRFNEVRNNLISLRRYILNLPQVCENVLLASLFKRAFKEDLTSSCKSYYKICKKTHQEYVNELLESLFVFDVRTNSSISLAEC